MIVHVR